MDTSPLELSVEDGLFRDLTALFVKFSEITCKHSDMWRGDGVHLSGEGYKQVAKELQKMIGSDSAIVRPRLQPIIPVPAQVARRMSAIAPHQPVPRPVQGWMSGVGNRWRGCRGGVSTGRGNGRK